MFELFDCSIFLVLDNAYPDKFIEWEFDQSTMWVDSLAKNRAKRAIVWLKGQKNGFYEISKLYNNINN